MLPGPILTRSEARPTVRVDRPRVSETLRDTVDALRERASVEQRNAMLRAAQAHDETGFAAEALRLAAKRLERLAADGFAAAEEIERCADRLAREGR